MGTRAVDAAHLQAYLEEFTFRFNRRRARSRGLLFHRLLSQAIRTGPVRFDDLTFGYWSPTSKTAPPSPPGVIRTLLVADRAAAQQLSRRLDPRFARIGRASTADEAAGQVAGLAAELVLIDGDRDDGQALDVVRAVRQAASRVAVVVHTSSRAGPSREELAAAGADLTVYKAGRQNLLDASADLIGSHTNLPF